MRNRPIPLVQQVKYALMMLPVILLLSAGLQQCQQLGIGKQCFICNTKYAQSKGPDVEVCGYNEMTEYRKKNTSSSPYYETTCRNK